jgi:hypothetical protein
VRPQRLDQLVAAHRPRAVQHQVGEQQAALAPAQRRVPPVTGELDPELAAELDAQWTTH